MIGASPPRIRSPRTLRNPEVRVPTILGGLDPLPRPPGRPPALPTPPWTLPWTPSPRYPWTPSLRHPQTPPYTPYPDTPLSLYPILPFTPTPPYPWVPPYTWFLDPPTLASGSRKVPRPPSAGGLARKPLSATKLSHRQERLRPNYQTNVSNTKALSLISISIRIATKR